jgi:DNA repair exonuclease SbcCD ATPase subunit
LFGLSDYEDAWNNLARFQRDYEVERDVRERDDDVIGLERFQTDYNRAVTDFASVEAEIGNLEMKSTQAESALKDADERLKNLEELRKKTEELGRKEAQLRANLVNLEDTCATLANQIEQKKKSINALEERLRLMDAQEKTHKSRLSEVGLDSNQTMEELKKQSETLGEQMAILRGEQESNRRDTTSSRQRISSLATESKCPLCLQALSEGYKMGLLERLQIDNLEREKKQIELQRNLEDLEALREVVSLVDSNLRMITPRREEVKTRIAGEYNSLNNFSDEFKKKQQEEITLRGELRAARAEVAKFDVTDLQAARKFRDKALFEHSEVRHKLEVMKTRKTDLSKRIDEIKNRLDQSQKKIERIEKIKRLLQIIEGIRRAYRSIQPRLRSEFINYLERTVQQVLNGLLSTAGPLLTAQIDETYTPIIKSEDGHERETSNISGGERTLLAFAYRLGLGQLIMQSRTGHGLFMLFLDEPTESLGREDGSVDRLAEAISRLKAIEQIIAVTHSEAFAEKAEHVIRIDKEAGVSSVSFQQ